MSAMLPQRQRKRCLSFAEEGREDLNKQDVGKREIFNLFPGMLEANAAAVSQDCDNTLICGLRLLAGTSVSAST